MRRRRCTIAGDDAPVVDEALRARSLSDGAAAMSVDLMRVGFGLSQMVRRYPPEEVTSIHHEAEVDPAEVGLTAADVDAIWNSVVLLYRSGLHPAIGVCVRRHGKVVLDRAIGHLRGNAPDDPADVPPVPIRHDSLFNLYSASKAVTAMVIHLLDQRGMLHLDDRIVEYIPEFGRHGKEGATIRHLLSHRAGIPAIPGHRGSLEVLIDPERVVALLCDARPVSVPGRQLSYHAVTSGFLLGEIVRRVTGRDIRRYLRDEILDPLGFAAFDYGVDASRVRDVAVNAFTGLPPFPPASWMLERSLGVGAREATALSNDPRFLTAIIPSGNIISSANEASRFFQLLLNEGDLDGVRIYEGRTVRRAVAEQSYLIVDSYLGLPVRYAMGFMLGSDAFSLYGPHSARAYGHIGFTAVSVYADPERAISVAILTSGKPFITPGQLLWLNVPRTIARHCGKVPRAPQ